MNYLILILFVVFNFSNVNSQAIGVDVLKQSHDKIDRVVSSKTTKQKTSKSLYVNPFIGTGGHGHTFPGATAPFGMMQLSPDTRYDGWDGCSGYHYSDSVIYGFSHTHLSGTGVPDYGDLLIVPQSGKLKTTPGYLSKKGYGDQFNHDDEKASPGFYSVKLLNQAINVRLTTTERAGMHEYTFQKKKGKKYLLIDLDHRDKLINQSIKTLDNQTISGYRISSAWANEQHFYFYIQLNTPFENQQYITKNGQHKLVLSFPSTTEKILLKVGMSAVDEKGAELNLKTEMPNWDFNEIRAKTVKKWDEELNKIDIKTTSPSILINFYTALYHTFIQPNIFNDCDGKYRGRDNQIHTIENNYSQYTVFSIWDTYRAANPLYTIIQPKRTTDFIHTFLRQFDQGGDLPVWELAGNETDCMIGYHSASIIADAYAKGIKDFDAQKALNAMVYTSKINELGKKQYGEKGFISSGDEPESVSKTLEYAYDDFCIAEMAKNLGKMDVYQPYYKRSMNFINLYDPQTKFMRARRDGAWYTPFDPTEVNFNYTEANSWQYSLYAPHAIDLLSQMMGGKDSLEHWLDRLFTTNASLSGRDQADITGLIGQYAHGNEPSHHMAYLYNYTNAPHKTSYYVDKIERELYATKPDGLSGNEDCGQMSAWYVLSSLGIYQIAPGNPWYDFGRPLIDQAELQLENGKTLKINVLNNSKENKYIQKIVLNGSEILINGITHQQLVGGGELILEMGSAPSKSIRSSVGSPITKEMALNMRFTPTPFFRVNNRVFENQLTVKIEHQQPLNWENIRVQYRFTDDTTKLFDYSNPFTIEKSCEIEARQLTSISPRIDFNSMPSTETNYSPWVKATFIKRDKEISLLLKSEYAHQYEAAGPNTLIDGVKGTKEFRTGDWQGFYAKDLVTEVKFEKPRVLKEIGISCLQDMKSWIFYPNSIEIEISYDGKTFEKLVPIATIQASASSANSPTIIPSFSTYVGPTIAEFYRNISTDKPISAFKVTAKKFGKCPSWHLGAGNDTWLFTDELIFR